MFRIMSMKWIGSAVHYVIFLGLALHMHDCYLSLIKNESTTQFKISPESFKNKYEREKAAVMPSNRNISAAILTLQSTNTVSLNRTARTKAE